MIATTAVGGLGSPDSISPLPDDVHRALPIVAAMGVISLVTTSLLALRLCWLFVKWRRNGTGGINQMLVLIFNLVLADFQQAIAFTINAHWLNLNAILVDDSFCWAQGWFVSTGDLSSGIFTLAIASHAFADIVFNYRLDTREFCASIAGCWLFVYLCSIIGIASHATHYFARAGPWCFINGAYNTERLMLHYFWIIVVELGTLVLYVSLVVILHRRVKIRYYETTSQADQARSAARLLMAYPLTYCICTLPLVTARLVSMSGGNPGYIYICVGGAFITSNGWLDVLLYTLTRSRYIVHGDVEEDIPVLETFHVLGQRFDIVTPQIGELDFWKDKSSPQSTQDSQWHQSTDTLHHRASMSLKSFDFDFERTRDADAVAHLHELPGYWERTYASTEHDRAPISPLPSLYSYSMDRTYAASEHDRAPISPLPSIYSYPATCLMVSAVEKG